MMIKEVEVTRTQKITVCDICGEAVSFDPLLTAQIGKYDLHTECVLPLIEKAVFTEA